MVDVQPCTTGGRLDKIDQRPMGIQLPPQFYPSPRKPLKIPAFGGFRFLARITNSVIISIFDPPPTTASRSRHKGQTKGHGEGV
jgi:hypothetical protein